MNLQSMVRSMGLSAFARLATLPATALSAVVTTHLLVGKLGVEQYGYIVLVGALFQLIPFADLGLGAAIVNATAKRNEGRSHSKLALATTRRAFRVLLCSGAAIMVLGGTIGLLGGWPQLLGLPSFLSESASWSMVLVLLPFAISLPLGIGQRILLGEGRNHVVNYVAVIGPVIAMLSTLLLLDIGVPPLVLGIATPIGVMCVSSVCFAIALRSTGWTLADIFFPRRMLPKAALWNSAIPMLVISITVPLAMQSGRIVLSHFSNFVELAEYSVAFQFYIPCFSVISTAAVTLWPIFSRSGARSNSLWIKSLLVLAAAGLVISLGFALLIGFIASTITDRKLTVPLDLAIAFAILLFVMALHQPSAVLLTSPRLLSFQAMCSTAMFAMNLALSVLFASPFGATGIVWATVLSVTLTQLVPCFLRARAFVAVDRNFEKVAVGAK